MTTARVLREVQDLEAIAPRWRSLLERSAMPQVVRTPCWQLAWWRVFGGTGGRALRVVAVEDEGRLVGLAPLLVRSAAHRGAIPVRRMELIATGEDEADEVCSDYVGVVAEKGREDQVGRALAAMLCGRDAGRWDELRMPSMSGEDPAIEPLAVALQRRGAVVETASNGASPYVPLPATWDDYLAALGASRRYLVTRSLRELDKWAPDGWAVRRARSPAELREGLTVLRDLHGERWTAVGKEGVFASERFARFHDAVLPRLLAGEDGASVELSWLIARGEPIAAAYNLVYAGRVQFYQSGRRVDLPKGLRPGIALHALLLREAIERGRVEYDFLAGSSRYKRDLALASRPLVTMRVVAPGLRARAVEGMRRLAERAIERVRRPR